MDGQFERIRILEELTKGFSYDGLENFLFHNGFLVKRDRYYGFDSKGLDISEVFDFAERKVDGLVRNLRVFTVKLNRELSERMSKKKQYDFAKDILRKEYLDAGIFVFHDDDGNFRFSLVFKVVSGIRHEYSYYKRYTFFVSPRIPNKTFILQLGKCNFSSFDSIKEAFSIEPVTKEFYDKIQTWYFWAFDSAMKGKISFPYDQKYSDDPEKNKEISVATNLIRLITRIIFVWFIKQKGLIPDEIFDKKKLKSIVKDFGKSTNYYNAILQNLFFATLNTPIEERGWVKSDAFKGVFKDYGVKSLYRYEDKFLISKDEVLELFKRVPFLNGGLFDCLDKEDENGKVVYVDGFSRNPKKMAIIPDYFFFDEDEKKVDLSNYGIGGNKSVKGLIEILKEYNFTTDEATPVDQEVALDPELLGKVFENLLASYNPETDTTARKATGSYYTPREIVEYMVDISLKEYFKVNLPEVGEEKIDILLSYSDEVPEFSEDEKRKILSLISEIKILDPACGSGAFPMGVLHKLVHILRKIDPDNKYWLELQREKVIEESERVFKESDKAKREKMLMEINEAFDESINYPDYARKLYLIENCIYGVDIQPIAIQISKLRFFISLVLDQKVDESKENFGIRPLPNLETKFVSANTLIGLDRPEQLVIRDQIIVEKEDELKAIRHRYFNAKTREKKLELQKKDRWIRKEISNLLVKYGWPEKTVNKVINFDIFDQNSFADWFDPEWMFGVVDGFDIVIGNPPYVRQEKIKHIKPQLEKQRYEVYISTADLYIYFYEVGYKLLKEKGTLCYITSNKWIRAKYGEKLRKFLKEKTTILKLIDFSGYRVFEQTVDTCILLFRKSTPPKRHIFEFLEVKSDVEDLESYLRRKENWQTMYQDNLSTEAWTLADEKVLTLKQKIENVGRPLREWNVRIYRGVLTGFNDAFIIDTETRNRILANCKDEEERKRTEEIIKPVLRGRDIEKWHYKWAGLWVIIIPAGWTNKNKGKTDPEKFFKQTFPSLYKHFLGFSDVKTKGKGLFYRDDQGDYWWELRHCDYYPEFEKEKVVWQRVSQTQKFTLVPGGFYCEATTHFISTVKEDTFLRRYMLGVLNSKLFGFAFYKFYMGGGIEGEIKGTFIEKFPLPPITSQNQQIANQIVALVDKILSIKNQNPSADISHLEKQIDQLVYKLYDLTEEEIKIVEGS